MYIVRPSYIFRKIYPKAIWKMSGSEKAIYLTFDDGPIPELTPWVLETLKAFQAKVTFFCVGNNVQLHPTIYKQILDDKHAVGNHTFNHLNGWTTNTIEYLNNINKCAELVDSKMFRPPYGKLKKSHYSLLTTHYSLIMWDVLSGDFDKNTSREKCLSNVIENTREGSIVVFHDSLKAKENLYYALPRFLEHFSAKGYSFKTINFIG